MRAVCGVKLLDKKITNDLMQILSLEETIDQLANSQKGIR